MDIRDIRALIAEHLEDPPPHMVERWLREMYGSIADEWRQHVEDMYGGRLPWVEFRYLPRLPADE